MGLLNNAPAFVAAMQGKAGGVAISYTRGSKTLAITAESLGAWVGRGEARSDRDGASRIEWGDRDYFVLVSALTSISASGEPEEGDRIVETVNGVARVFEVIRPDNGEPAWRWSDEATRTWYRLHVKEQKV